MENLVRARVLVLNWFYLALAATVAVNGKIKLVTEFKEFDVHYS